MKQYELSIRDYWRIIKKRWRIIVITALVFQIVTVAVTVVQKKEALYNATASVRVERSTSTVGLFVEVLSVSSGDPISTAGLMIKSYAVLEKVAKADGLIPRDAAPDNEKYGKIISELQGRIKTEQEGNASIIDVTISSSDPKEAERLANLVVEKYKEENILLKNRQIFEAKKFIEEQLKTVESRLKTAEDALNTYRTAKDIVSISDEEKNTLDRFSKMESEKDRLDMAMKEYEYYLDVLREGKAIPVQAKPRPYTEGDATTGIIARLNARLSELMLERDNLLIGFTPAHPQVKDVDDKILNVRTELMYQIQAKLRTVQSMKESNLAAMGNLRGKLYELPPTAMEVNRLEREIKIDQDLFSLLRTKYQEVLIKESEKVEEVSIIKRATEPTERINPPKTFQNAMLGLVLGGIFGIVFVFVLESLDTSIGTIEDVELFIGIPVIAVIPKLDTADVTDFLQETYKIEGDQIKKYLRLISHFMSNSIPAECYRSLRTNIFFDTAEKNLKSLMITSSSGGEGKSLTVLNLAIVLAQAGKRVLIVDADLRNPNIHLDFGLGRSLD